MYLQISLAATENEDAGYDPVNAIFVCPITVSLASNPDIENVPVEAEDADVIVPSVTAPSAADPNVAWITLGPVAPIRRVPVVSLFDIVEFVTASDVAVNAPIVAVEIVAVLAERVPIVAVPVDAVIFEPKVTLPS